MRRLTIIVAIVLGLLLVGCGQSYNPPANVPTNSLPSNGLPADGQPPENITWISPGKVGIDNFYPGARVECYTGAVCALNVHNGNDYTANFLISYRYPDHVEIGYVKPTNEVQDWIVIVDPTPVLAPYETRVIPVILEMPTYAEAPGDKWEFWISVMDKTQTGMVQTELCTRWLITMRD